MMILVLSLLVIVPVAVYTAYWSILYFKYYHIPGEVFFIHPMWVPWHSPLVRDRSQRHLYFQYLLQKYGNIIDQYEGTINKGIAKVQLGTEVIVVMCSRDDMKQILVRNANIFKKKECTHRHLDVFGSANVFTSSDNREWDRHRLMSTVLTRSDFLSELHHILSQEFEKMVQSTEFQTHLMENSRTELNISECIRIFCLNVLGKALFAFDIDQLQMSNSLIQMVDIIIGSMNYEPVVPIPNFLWKTLPIGLPKMTRANVKKFKNLLTSIIKKREEEIQQYLIEGRKPPYLDALTLMLLKRRDDNIHFTDKEIISNIFAFIYAGKDTVSSALQWAVYHLCKYPDCQEKLQREIDRHIGGFNIPTFERFKALSCEYLEFFIKESLRLKPPVIGFHKFNTKSVILESSGIYLPSNTHVYGSIIDRHISDDFAVPLIFDPDRFMDKSSRFWSCEFIPFSAGPRDCIGRYFSLDAMRYFITRLMQEFTVNIRHFEEIPMKVIMTTCTPAQDIKVRIEKRISHEYRIASA